MTSEQKCLGRDRLKKVFFSHDHKGVRERADVLLFVAGLIVEYALLAALILGYTVQAPSMLLKVLSVVVLGSLFFALAVHQFLVFRNYSLHYSLSNGRLIKLELFICLLFGVLTGELGYLCVLVVCNFPTALALEISPERINWFFAQEPLAMNDKPNVLALINWLMHGLGAALKSIFALGAAVLSFMILVWDIRASRYFPTTIDKCCGDIKRSEDEVKSSVETATLDEAKDAGVLSEVYEYTKVFFYLMDILATVTWIAVLGVVLPRGLLGAKPLEWCAVLAVVSFLYAAIAILRLLFAINTLGKLSSDEVSLNTVI